MKIWRQPRDIYDVIALLLGGGELVQSALLWLMIAFGCYLALHLPGAA